MNQSITYNNEKGSSLPLIIIIGVGLSSGILYYFTRLNMQKQIAVKQKVDTEIEEVFTKVSSLFVSPANCNANFYSTTGFLPIAGNLMKISKCTNGQTCRPGSPIDYSLLEYNVTESTWDTNITKTMPHVRIGKAEYTLIHTQNGNPDDPSVLKLDIEFQKHYGNINKFVKVKRTVEFSVILNSSLDSIIGCPKSPNTITVY